MTNTFDLRNRLDAEFEKESDRGCAILTLCLLEEALAQVFAAFLPRGGQDARHFMPKGRLFVGITNAHKLGLLSDKDFATFKVLLEIRNTFAHSILGDVTFSKDHVRVKIEKLGLPDLDAVPDVLDELNGNPRKRFMMAIDNLFFTLNRLANKIDRLNSQKFQEWKITRYAPPQPRT